MRCFSGSPADADSGLGNIMSTSSYRHLLFQTVNHLNNHVSPSAQPAIVLFITFTHSQSHLVSTDSSFVPVRDFCILYNNQWPHGSNEGAAPKMFRWREVWCIQQHNLLTHACNPLLYSAHTQLMLPPQQSMALFTPMIHHNHVGRLFLFPSLSVPPVCGYHFACNSSLTQHFKPLSEKNSHLFIVHFLKMNGHAFMSSPCHCVIWHVCF